MSYVKNALVSKGFTTEEIFNQEVSKYKRYRKVKILEKRLNKGLTKIIKTKSTKEFQIKIIIFHRVLKRFSKYRTEILFDLDEKTINKLFTVHYKSYLRNIYFWNTIIGEDLFFSNAIFMIASKLKKVKNIKERDKWIELIDEKIMTSAHAIRTKIAIINSSLPCMYLNRSITYGKEGIYQWESAIRVYGYLISLDWYINKGGGIDAFFGLKKNPITISIINQ